MTPRIIGYDINSAILWTMEWHDKWMGTSTSQSGFIIFTSRVAGIEFFLKDYPHTDLIEASTATKYTHASPSHYKAATLADWVEGKLNE